MNEDELLTHKHILKTQYLICNTATNPCLKTCPCLSILSWSAAIDWLKRLCESIQSCFGHQRYYINVILRNRL